VGTLWTEEYTGKFAAEEERDSTLESMTIGPVFVQAVYAGELPLGALEWESFESLSWRKSFLIYRDLDFIDVRIDLTYSGRGTEVNVEFPLDIDAQRARALYEIPFGSVAREPYPPDRYEYGRGNWAALSWLDYSDDGFGVTLAHNGTPGCLAKDGVVSFTLLRSATAGGIPCFPTIPSRSASTTGRIPTGSV